MHTHVHESKVDTALNLFCEENGQHHNKISYYHVFFILLRFRFLNGGKFSLSSGLSWLNYLAVKST